MRWSSRTWGIFIAFSTPKRPQGILDRMWNRFPGRERVKKTKTGCVFVQYLGVSGIAHNLFRNRLRHSPECMKGWSMIRPRLVVSSPYRYFCSKSSSICRQRWRNLRILSSGALLTDAWARFNSRWSGDTHFTSQTSILFVPCSSFFFMKWRYTFVLSISKHPGLAMWPMFSTWR